MEVEDSVFQHEYNIVNMGEVQTSHTFDDILKSRTNVNYVITKKVSSRATNNVNKVILTVIGILLLNTFVEYFLVTNNLRDMQDYFSLIQLSNHRAADYLYVQANIRDLNLMHRGLFDWEPSQDRSQRELQLREDLAHYLAELDQINSKLQLSKLQLSGPHKALIGSNAITMHQNERGEVQMQNLNVATEQIISKCLLLKNLPLAEFALE